MAKILNIDPDKCTGCRTCELVCSLQKEQEFNPARARIQHITFPRQAISIPLTCLQCEEPFCMKICPSGALTKAEDSGAIRVREEACLGCRMCTMACPFGQIIVGPRGKAEKCDLCLGEPTCVEFCPSGALAYIESERIRVEKGIYLAQKLKESFPGLQ